MTYPHMYLLEAADRASSLLLREAEQDSRLAIRDAVHRGDLPGTIEAMRQTVTIDRDWDARRQDWLEMAAEEMQGEMA